MNYFMASAVFNYWLDCERKLKGNGLFEGAAIARGYAGDVFISEVLGRQL